MLSCIGVLSLPLCVLEQSVVQLLGLLRVARICRSHRPLHQLHPILHFVAARTWCKLRHVATLVMLRLLRLILVLKLRGGVLMNIRLVMALLLLFCTLLLLEVEHVGADFAA